jgi:hypothetical protein
MPDDDTVQAAMYGPLVLAAKYEKAPRAAWYGDTGPFEGKEYQLPPLPSVQGNVAYAASWIEAGPTNEPLMFKIKSDTGEAVLVPVNSIVHERYNIYWKIAGTHG